MSKISIIIPVYNREKYIKNTIYSVLNQTYKNFELILVDDFSTDNTFEILKIIQKKDERVKVLRLFENSGGPAKPRNEGIKISKGKYIFFLDSDDILLPYSLEKRLNIFLNSGIDIINSNAWVVDYKKRKIIDWLNGNTSCLAVKKEVFEKIGFLNEKISGSDELEFIIRYNIKTFNPKIYFLKEPTIIYFRHTDQISELVYKDDKILKFIQRDIKMLEILQSYLKEFPEKKYYLKQYINYTYFWLSYRYTLLGDFENSLKYFYLIDFKNFEFYFLKYLIYLLNKLKNKKIAIFSDKLIKLVKNNLIKPLRVKKLKSKYFKSYLDTINYIKKL